KVIGLLGSNGSGKTTLLKLIAGILTPTSGELAVCGMPIGLETKAVVSYLPERTYLNDWMKVEDIIAYFADFYEDFSTEKAYAMLKSLEVDPKRKLKTLSKGTKEKVQLVLVMARNARLYLLDEPIAGVDPVAREFILDTIVSNYNKGATVLVSTHLITDVEKVLDSFVFIRNGKLIMQGDVAKAREAYDGKTIDEIFREVYKQCSEKV
ncbi:MAG: ABC transporter ATP-binding protein, partial [Clostridia bacterium]|nr:ABC transporter ATP-binding protein [Clostridia bacterium]